MLCLPPIHRRTMSRTTCTMSLLPGTDSFSNTGVDGFGTNGEPMRRADPSRDMNRFSPTVAAISEAIEHDKVTSVAISVGN
jgi:hypothetical protein